MLFRLLVNLARSRFSATNCWSLWSSALTNSARLRTTAKKSPRPLFRAVNASDRLSNAVLISWPLPASPSANDSMASPIGPLGCSGVGPNLLMMLVTSLRSVSHSTGTSVRSSGMTALSPSTGPPR
nr:hypothetical protein CPGR_02841 [Mycolicibacter nonchromogenicus]